MTEIDLLKIKSIEVQADNLCKAFMNLYCHSYIGIAAKQSKYLL